MIGDILTELGQGIVSFMPNLAEAMYNTFLKLFFVVSAEGSSGYELNVLGEISILFLIISACYKFLPTVVGWFRMRMATRRARKNNAKVKVA